MRPRIFWVSNWRMAVVMVVMKFPGSRGKCESKSRWYPEAGGKGWGLG